MASKVVAVAGGSGKLGRAIVDELIAHGSYKVFILGRKANAEKSKELGAPILAIDYNDADTLANILESNDIDTVVSTIGGFSTDPELALIAAADKSKVTKRYIPSFWGTRYTPEVASIFPLANIKLSLLSVLSTTSLTYTTVVNGLFMDYFGFPHIKSYLGPFPIVLDIAAARAAIPGSGAAPITLTYSFDIGRYVARLLQNPSWDKESVIVGDKVSWNEFLTIAEEVRGLKFDVVHDSMELLQQGKVTELPGHAALYPYLPKETFQGMAAVFGILMEKGLFDFEKKDVGFKTKTAKELVEEAWKGK